MASGKKPTKPCAIGVAIEFEEFMNIHKLYEI